jgi:ABC-type dipeptide/oligopeptide/nickel transport system permease subunit
MERASSAGVLILAESGLSFIGLGVQSPQFS